MSNLEIAALIFVALWLGILTLVALLTVRQVALVSARIEQAGVPQYIDDGPALQGRLPEEVIESLPQLDRGVTNLLLMSASCTPCRQLAEGLQHAVLPKNGTSIALVPGREELANGVAELLPPSIQVVRDPKATDLAQALDFQRVPAAIVIERGRVIAKAPPDAVSSADELVKFLVQSSVSSTGKTLIPA